jgi:isoquinoline 1-oxidoreductase beta subunit
MTTKQVGRREFLKTGAVASVGLLVGFRFAHAQDATDLASAAADFAPNGYLKVGTDGAITIFADHVELGQGSGTALPMIVAEELDVEWSKVRVERMPDDPSAWPRSIMTVGSQAVRTSYAPLRKAGATAREMLARAGAQSWNVDRAQVRTEKGFVIHPASGRRASYGDLAEAAGKIAPPANPPLKDPKDFQIIGTHVHRVDIPGKVNGSSQFGIDVRVPGMLYATVVRSPVIGGKLKSFDATDAKAVAGVKDVVQFQNGIAVLATDTWSALKGRKALKSVEWDDAANANLSSDGIRKQFTDLAGLAGAVQNGQRGDVAAALQSAGNAITVDYELPYAAHATMEPMNCTAHVRADGADVWVPTQAPTRSQSAAAAIAGLPLSAVKLHVMMVGGGFGRRSRTDDFLDDAVRLSKMTGAPVKVMWTREDDIQHDWYRPFGIHRMSGAVGTDGMPVAWLHRIVSQNALGAGDTVSGAADLPYAIPNFRVELNAPSIAVPVSPWRSVGHSQNGFVTEAFLDELAAAGKQDPVALRRKLLVNAPRYLAAMELAVSKSDWGKPMPKGSGRGIAVHAMTNSYVAQIAEVTVAANVIRVNKVICGVDCGVVINPDTMAAQIEGGIIYGLTCALKNEITITRGKVDQDNFNSYPMLRISEAPHVEVHSVPSTEAPGGVGEPGVPPIAAAVANAVFAATGKRLRKLPFRLA